LEERTEFVRLVLLLGLVEQSQDEAGGEFVFIATFKKNVALKYEVYINSSPLACSKKEN